jgi:adenosine kinase
MSVLVTGSIAFDHIMVFEDRFRNRILPDQVHILNVSFPVPSLEKRWGGTAGNIAYNLKLLGVEPVVRAAVGADFGPYAEWLDRHGIRRDRIHVLEDALTSQCFIVTDLDDNQIAAFHPGAMDRAHEAPLGAADLGVRAGIVAPNGKQAMIDHARALKQGGVPCVVDPGQGLPLFDGAALLELMDGAAVFVVNDYEWAMTLERTGESEDALAARVGALVVTRGERGSWLREGSRRADVPAVKAARVVDPTGCGDAYRAGLLYALAKELPLLTGARLGSLLGSLKVERPGPQSIRIDLPSLRTRFEREFGSALG